MGDGTTRPIESISVGDVVLSFDERTRKMTRNKVRFLFVHPRYPRFVTLDGGRLVTTPEHHFYLDGRWVAARDLRPGDSLTTVSPGAGLAPDEAAAAAMPIERRRINAISSSDGDATVYNFEVENTHTYVVDGVIVHNRIKN